MTGLSKKASIPMRIFLLAGCAKSQLIVLLPSSRREDALLSFRIDFAKRHIELNSEHSFAARNQKSLIAEFELVKLGE